MSLEASLPEDPVARKVAIFEEMMRAWAAKDATTCSNLFTENGAMHSMMIDPIVGREAIYQRIKSLEASNKKFHGHILRSGLIGDGTLVTERVDELVIDGVSRSYPVVGLLDFEGDKISMWKEYYDRNQLLRAQGRTVEVTVS